MLAFFVFNTYNFLRAITVELTITNKKELKIQLFDVLDKLVSSDNFNLEVLSGSNLRTFVENFDAVIKQSQN